MSLFTDTCSFTVTFIMIKITINFIIVKFYFGGVKNKNVIYFTNILIFFLRPWSKYDLRKETLILEKQITSLFSIYHGKVSPRWSFWFLCKLLSSGSYVNCYLLVRLVRRFSKKITRSSLNLLKIRPLVFATLEDLNSLIDWELILDT